MDNPVHVDTTAEDRGGGSDVTVIGPSTHITNPLAASPVAPPTTKTATGDGPAIPLKKM